MPDRTYDREKLKCLLHYVIKAAGARPKFGAVKLYKVAWFADASAYLRTGKSITGATYIREKHGPIPKDAMSIRSELVRTGAISQMNGGEYIGWKFKALANPDPNCFSQDELDTVNYWIKHIDENHTATSISDESHDYGWDIASMGEELPFTAHMAERTREPNEKEKARLTERAKAIGLF